MDRNVDVAIVGAGTAGLNALAQVRRATDRYVLINGGEPGTTCARVGCMPSKVVIQIADDFHRRAVFPRQGIEGGEGLVCNIPDALEHVRDLRDIFVDRVLAKTIDQLGDRFVEGYARFVEPTVLDVDGTIIRARRVVVATGSTPVVPQAWRAFGDRILTTDSLFEQPDLPRSMAVVGLGVVGLELGQALVRLGIAVTGIDRLHTVGGLADPEVNRAAIEILGKEFPLWLGSAADVTARDGRLAVRAGDHEVVVDAVLASLGRRPNLGNLGLDELGAAFDPSGIPRYNRNTMQIGDLPIFLAGDVTGERAILHEAVDEGRIAGLNAVADTPVAYRRKTTLAITFTDPNIATVGTAFNDLDEADTVVGEMRFGPVGRALIMGRNKGILRVYADRSDGRLLGAAVIGPKGENIAHLLAWSIQRGERVFDLLRYPYYHPAIEETLQAALRDLVGRLEALPQDTLELEPLD